MQTQYRTISMPGADARLVEQPLAEFARNISHHDSKDSKPTRSLPIAKEEKKGECTNCGNCDNCGDTTKPH